MIRFPLIVLLFLCVTASFAQSKKKRNKREAENTQQPSSITPYSPDKEYAPKKKKKSRNVTYNAREDFYDRMEQVAKDHRKAEKELEKPQYSDPSYFGHKRPPKKRPPNKMKFCKVCEIRH